MLGNREDRQQSCWSIERIDWIDNRLERWSMDQRDRQQDDEMVNRMMRQSIDQRDRQQDNEIVNRVMRQTIG